VAMLSSVLRSERAVQVNVTIMRAFVSLRRMLTVPLVSGPFSPVGDWPGDPAFAKTTAGRPSAGRTHRLTSEHVRLAHRRVTLCLWFLSPAVSVGFRFSPTSGSGLAIVLGGNPWTIS